MVKRPSRNRGRFDDDEEEPMAGLSNLADVMLVFSCGLMVALAVYWNVSVNSTQTEVVEQDQLSDAVDMDKLLASTEDGKGLYIHRGEAFEDPATGKMYVLEKADDADSGS
jgi:hypothetical protein